MILWLPTADEGMQSSSKVKQLHCPGSLVQLYCPDTERGASVSPDVGTCPGCSLTLQWVIPTHSDTSLHSHEGNSGGSHLIRETGFWCSLWQDQASKSKSAFRIPTKPPDKLLIHCHWGSLPHLKMLWVTLTLEPGLGWDIDSLNWDLELTASYFWHCPVPLRLPSPKQAGQGDSYFPSSQSKPGCPAKRKKGSVEKEKAPLPLQHCLCISLLNVIR